MQCAISMLATCYTTVLEHGKNISLLRFIFNCIMFTLASYDVRHMRKSSFRYMVKRPLMLSLISNM